jgi:uncharacterized membrane protein YoaK (UPF0700 family)
VCFDRVFEVFPANQSGNAVLLGIGLGRVSVVAAWRPAVAIFGFGVGVALGIVLGRRLGRPGRAELLVGLEILMLAPVAIVVLDTANPLVALEDVAAAVLLLLTSMAMGLQTEVIGRVAGINVATTYQSGAIARIAEATVARRQPGSSAPPWRALVVLCSVLAGYVGGAALGATLGSARGSLVVPVALLAVLVVWLSATARRSRPVV